MLIQHKLKPYQTRHAVSGLAWFSFGRGNDARKGGLGHQPLADDCGREIREYSLSAAMTRGKALAAKFDIVSVRMTDPRTHETVVIASQELA